jgi:hypothetical protein
MGKAQRVTLKVCVDGRDAPALGVLSQGELNAMTLSLFLPRVLLDATPFGSSSSTTPCRQWMRPEWTAWPMS